MRLQRSLPNWWKFLALLAALPFASWGQGYTEGATLSTEWLPLSGGQPSHEAGSGAYITRGSVVIPCFLKADKSQALLLGAGGEFFRFTGSRAGFAGPRLYAVAPVLGYTRRLTPQCQLTGIFIATLNSDYQQLAGSDVQYGGLVRGVYRVRPTLALRAALGYRQTFYGPTYLVLGGLDWQVSRRVRIFGDVPANLTVAYTAARRVNAGLELAGSYATYRLPLADEYLRYRTFLAGLFGEYYVRPKLALRARVGYSLIRNLEAYRQSDRAAGVVDFFSVGPAPAPISPAIGNGVTVQLALSYRLPAQ